MAILALGRNIVVERIEEEVKTASGIIIPVEEAKKQDTTVKALVKNISEQLLAEAEESGYNFRKLKVGDIILTRFYTGLPVYDASDNNKEICRIIDIKDVLAIEVHSD